MEDKQSVRGWSHLLSRLRRDNRGAIAPLAAVVITAALVGVGASIDISRLVTARTQLQDAVDSADLALARMPASTSNADMQAKAQAWITANVTDPNIKNLVVATPIRTLGQVQLNVTASINTTMASLVGVSSLPLQGHSTVKYGTTHVELALVLDNTGSMNDDNKLSSLKSAATTLVNTLYASAQASQDPNALKVAIVPFSMTVNVGSQYQGQSWLKGAMPAEYGATADAVGANHPDRFQLFTAMNPTGNKLDGAGKKLAWGGCVESRPMPYDVSETAPDPANPATYFVPFFAPDEPDAGTYTIPGYGKYNHLGSYSNSSVSWENNYLADGFSDGQQNSGGGDYIAHQTYQPKYNTMPTPALSGVWVTSGSPAQSGNYIGPNAGCTVQAIQRLTTNTSNVNSQINSMVAGGGHGDPAGSHVGLARAVAERSLR